MSLFTQAGLQWKYRAGGIIMSDHGGAIATLHLWRLRR